MKDEVIKKLIDYIDGSKDFLLDQAPQIFREILFYDYMQNIYTLVVAIIISIAGIVSFFIFRKTTESTSIARYISIWAAISGVSIVLCVIPELIQIKTAPKYYLIEKLLKIGKK